MGAPKSRKPSEQLKGTIAIPAVMKESNGKLPVASFMLKTLKGDLIKVKAFGDAAHDLKNHANVQGAPVTIRGHHQADLYDGESFVMECMVTADKAISSNERIIREYGSLSAFKKLRAEKKAADEAKGLVEVTSRSSSGTKKFLVSSYHAMAVHGCNKLKIEYCMDILGDKEVTKRLQALGCGAVMTEAEVSKYYEFREELVNEARKLEEVFYGSTD